MAKKTAQTPKQKQVQKQIKEITKQVEKLQTAHANALHIENALGIRIVKSQSRFERIKNPKGADHGVGSYLLIVGIQAKKEDIYIPISIASGKKTAGFMYQLEGTAKGTLAGSSIACKGEGTSVITIGTIVYAKIPTGKKAEFRMQFEIKGKVGQSYKAVISRINYKHTPTDARYTQYPAAISTDTLQFN